ncbi:apolipoprotein D-like [Eurosta solidaginis]|uniref:apolipoprotein D-like n=1 Tax=Eurosta solidaginis TaxID=178769 RepID=UPI0035309A14
MLKHQFAMVHLSILIFLTSSCLVAGVPKPGPCPNIAYERRVDLRGFKGTWFLQSVYPFEEDEPYRCEKSDCILESNDYTAVKKFQINNKDGTVDHRTGTLILLSDGQVQSKFDDDALSFNYKILSVDYEKYVIYYLCKDLLYSERHAEYISIYTRDLKPSNKVKKGYLNALEDRGISTKELVPASHEDCGDYGESVTKQLKELLKKQEKQAKKAEGVKC